MSFVQEARRALVDSFFSLLAWVFFTPIAFVVPRKSRSVIVMGRQGGQFLDNAKYFFMYGAESDEYATDVIFLTADRKLCSDIIRLGGRAKVYPSAHGAWALLRAQVVVYDAADWMQNGRHQLSYFAYKVQLWHGAPLKQIELPLHQKRLNRLPPVKRMLLVIYKLIIARYVGSDLLISTSCYFTERAFSEAFKSKDILASGYPRNDILCESETTDYVRNGLLRLNTDDQIISRIEESRRDGKRIIMYMPTFRKDRHNPFDNGILDISRMADFAIDNKVLLVFKFHPLMAKYCNLEDIDSIVQYDPSADIYPVLPLCDCLITDYSSIYFDYLFIDRPIIFFPYDYDQYTADDRQLLFDYDEMTPGRKCYNQGELEKAMNDMLIGRDDYMAERQTVFEKTFDHRDGGASSRIWSYIETNYFS